jgi:hypothetical protein
MVASSLWPRHSQTHHEGIMEGDFCTTDGARRIKLKIQEYWRDRGYDVAIDLVEEGFVPAMRSGRTDVRSDMVNGLPRRRAVAEAA